MARQRVLAEVIRRRGLELSDRALQSGDTSLIAGGAGVVEWIAGLSRHVDCPGVAATRVVCFLLICFSFWVKIVGVEGDFSADVHVPRLRWKFRH